MGTRLIHLLQKNKYCKSFFFFLKRNKKLAYVAAFPIQIKPDRHHFINGTSFIVTDRHVELPHMGTAAKRLKTKCLKLLTTVKLLCVTHYINFTAVIIITKPCFNWLLSLGCDKWYPSSFLEVELRKFPPWLSFAHFPDANYAMAFTK